MTTVAPNCHVSLVVLGQEPYNLYRPVCLAHGDLTGGFFTRQTAGKIAGEHLAEAP